MTEQQEKLIDVDIEAAPEIKALARAYAKTRDERMELTRGETELRSKLIALMHENELTVFESDGLRVEIVVPDEKVKVKIAGDDREIADDDEVAEG